MKQQKWIRFVSFFSVMLGFVAPAMAVPTNSELKIGITQEFENFNPEIFSMQATFYMSYLAVRNFEILTPDGKWVPQMIKSIPSLQNKGAKLATVDGKKGLIATYEILDAANWGDGVPVTCDDLKFAWEVGNNPIVSIPARDAFENIKSIEWDPKTPKKCVVTYKQAKWDFDRNMITPIPRHVDQKAYTQYSGQKDGYEQNSEYNKNPTNPGLYNGPYMISELKLGSHVTFIPNPYFYGKAPAIKKVIFKLIPNSGTLAANLKSGTIDMISPIGFAFDEALAFQKEIAREDLPLKMIIKPGLTYEHIDLDLENPILKDIRVRKALVTAINREELTKALFEGKQQPALHQFTTIDPWYSDDPKFVTKYKYSKAEAGKLLDEAGWKMGADGYRAKDGKRLSIPFMTTAGNKTRETVQTYLQSSWKAVGVEVVIKNEPARVFFGETMTHRKFGGMAMYAWTSSPELSQRSTLHSSQIPSEKNSFSGQNESAWSNPQVDKLIESIDLEFNPSKRKDMAHQIIKFYTDEIPVIPLYYRAENAVVPKNLAGYRLVPHQFNETNEIENWSLQTQMQ